LGQNSLKKSNNINSVRRTQISKRVSTILKIGIGLAFLIFAFWRVDWAVFTRAIKNIHWTWFIFAILSIPVSLFFKVWRWRVLLKYHQIDIPLMKAISAYFVGAAVNILFFIRGGEIVRIGLAHQSEKNDLANITATIGLEKYFDLIMLIFSMLMISAFLPSIAIDRWARLSPLLVILSAFLLLAVLIGPTIWKKFSKSDFNRGLIGKISKQIEILINAVRWLRNPRKLIAIVAISLFIWLVMLSTNMLLFHALGLILNWQAAGLVLVLVYIGVLPALMPGNIGPFIYFAQLALVPFSVNNEQALAFAILLFAIVTMPPLIIAGISLMLPGTREKPEPSRLSEKINL